MLLPECELEKNVCTAASTNLPTLLSYRSNKTLRIPESAALAADLTHAHALAYTPHKLDLTRHLQLVRHVQSRGGASLIGMPLFLSREGCMITAGHLQCIDIHS